MTANSWTTKSRWTTADLTKQVKLKSTHKSKKEKYTEELKKRLRN